MRKSDLMSSASSLKPYVTEPRDIVRLPGGDFWMRFLFGADECEPRTFSGLVAKANVPDGMVLVDWTPR